MTTIGSLATAAATLATSALLLALEPFAGTALFGAFAAVTIGGTTFSIAWSWAREPVHATAHAGGRVGR